MNLTNLYRLDLSSNNITVDAGTSITFPCLAILDLSSCELKNFPCLLTNVKNLSCLDISNNKIRGQIPKWFSNMRCDALRFLNLSYNSLKGI
uniref:Leucine-rich repeat-containing N-terminal plant-type domain-containing protein n=1 Tax=Solanum lycopersicum TaxID=4081 RepID=A0A3Q7FHI3_SOLLC